MSYNTNIIEVGPMVPAFEEEMLIVLFGPNAPDALREISVIHEAEDDSQKVAIQPGSKMELGESVYTVVDVGSQAVANFEELGHISIYFKTEMDELLPGAIQVEPEIFPRVDLGQTIRFYE